MNLYDFLLLEKADFDTYDTVFDVCVTVCEPYEYEECDEKEYYDIFNELSFINCHSIGGAAFYFLKFKGTSAKNDKKNDYDEEDDDFDNGETINENSDE